jgi:predicted nucleic acid-binding protein
VPVTKYVVDAAAALHLVAEEIPVAGAHQLLAPTLLRSQALALMHEAVARGEVSDAVARDRLRRLDRMRIRLLGDGLLRRQAWKVADRLGWDSTYDAEYVALTQLQADALVTLDEKLAAAVRGLVETAGVDALRG